LVDKCNVDVSLFYFFACMVYNCQLSLIHQSNKIMKILTPTSFDLVSTGKSVKFTTDQELYDFYESSNEEVKQEIRDIFQEDSINIEFQFTKRIFNGLIN